MSIIQRNKVMPWIEKEGYLRSEGQESSLQEGRD